MSSLRAKLNGLLALSLAAPVAAALPACRGSDAARPVADASDASGAPSLREAGADAGPPDDANACAPVPVEAGFFGEDGSCDRFVRLPCGVPAALEGVRCNPSVDLCTAVCPDGFFFLCHFPPPTCEDGGVAQGAPVYLDCSACINPNGGRRPVGLSPPRGNGGGSQIGSYFARLAYLEEASIEAFVQLHARLTSFGAPARLRREALRAAEDEKRHARIAARFARLYGGEIEAPPSCAHASLTFEELALENAVEGCVRETFAALVAMHQAERATDPRVARAMRRIAEDETRHADLAWAVHRWALPRLSEAARRRVRCGQRRALADLKGRGGESAPEVVRIAGLPGGAAKARLLQSFGHTLFGERGESQTARLRRRGDPANQGVGPRGPTTRRAMTQQ